MKHFVVTYTHSDLDGWAAHREAHRAYLARLVERGILCVSGPFRGTSTKSAMLILIADDEREVREILSSDPFYVHQLVEPMSITEWDPIFGSVGIAGQPKTG